MSSGMKNARAPRAGRGFSLAIILGLLLPFLGCGGRSSEWRGKIEVVNGVTVVKNPREGIWDSQGRPGLSMIDVRRIGTMEGAEETAFAEISDVAVGSRGDIYVGDRKLCEVRKFAADGRHLLTFGRKGQGPGEFQSVKTVSVGPEGQIILFDDMMQRLSEFSEDGRLLKVTRRLDETRWIGPRRVFRSGDGYVLFGGYALLQKAEDGLKLFHEFGPEGAPAASYIDYEFGDNREFEENSIGFFPGQCDFQGPDDIFYAHYYYDNRILVYKDKKLARVLERESGIPKPYDVRVFRDVDKAIALQREYELGTFGRGVAFLGTAYQNSLGLFRLPDGRVVNFVSIRREKGRWDLAVELYDASGRLLTYSVLGENPALDVRRVDGNGLFYAIERKDFPKIVMFRLSF